jgi:hypothetical protein
MLVKPDSIANLCATCPDSKWVGDVMRKLFGQDVALDFGQQQTYEVIKRDCDNFDQRLVDRRERDAKRKAEYRAKKEQAENVPQCPTGHDGTQALSHDVPQDTPPVPRHTIPSQVTSYHVTPSQVTSRQAIDNNNVSVSVAAEPPTRAPAPEVRADRHDVPTLKTVVDAATSVMNVSEGYARWWYAEMEARDWTTSDGMRISTRNWRPQLKSWWNRAKPEERDEADRLMRKREAAKPKTYAPKDWALCEEQCACYLGNGRCRCGHVVPPDQRPHRIPPTECQHFVELKPETAK